MVKRMDIVNGVDIMVCAAGEDGVEKDVMVKLEGKKSIYV